MSARLHLLTLVVAAAAMSAGATQTTAQTESSNSRRSSSLVQEKMSLTPDTEVLVEIPMCCGVDQVFNMSGMSCEPAATKPVIAFHYEDGRPVEYQFAYNVTVGFPNCTFYSLQPTIEPSDEFFLLPDGQLMVSAGDKEKLDKEKFCLLATKEEMEAIVCFPDAVRASKEPTFHHVVYQTLYPIGMIISSIFLALTLFVYCLVVELRDLLGRCLICAVASLCLAQISTVVVQLATHKLSMTECIFTAVMMHFWYMAAFFWLNVICFNVFLTVWWKNDASFGRRWFIMYSIYAWGFAVLISAVALARDFHDGLQDSPLPKPNFGLAKCWFSDDDSLIVYFYGPTSVVLGINVILFCMSAYKLCTFNKNSEARVFQFTLYLKLFVLMGVTWVFEGISFFVQRHNEASNTKYIWLVFDLINIMQGVIIFIVFVCRRAVLMRVCEVVCGKAFAMRRFPAYYENAEEDPGNHEMKHTVI
ncbi:probable G-protein coupled receptor Mth-like 3 isoform X1 [Penaeus japonicus]|uniref:probable G-protein coupled receptor Mth-like 3 isoform X1 n=1 Tax=Penaeus japonicus TaxID=27405 RepID=UPI001C71544F|nr:probable G-protein coupled receptor Mth-like 3 isoform X1 [Penaeus japonicus]